MARTLPTFPLHPPPLDCDVLVFRAIRKGWIDAETGDISSEAFMLREIDNGHLSVAPNPDRARDVIKNCAAVRSLLTGKVRDNNLDVIVDTPHHASIQGWNDINDRCEAEEVATRLIRISRTTNDNYS